ncbi:hypothetical protein ASPCAL01848 [Aspergillus calidoustus]|uniref:Helicase ATP-binding domain-containing protein n=1 Tax=Aspergillus calidoustus TaxID=454130 RepID=A0A0U5GM89_ASPCI|nr:hypothetical protein ASPCAL01848 [Aspergillus calidoustus]
MSESTEDTALTPTGPSQPEEVICYGSLYEGRVAHRGKKVSFQKFCKSAGSLEQFPVLRKDDNCFTLKDKGDNDFAILDTSTTAALNLLQGLANLSFCAIPRPVTGNQGASPVVEVSINIYGPFSHYRQVGSRLATQKYYLQHPDVVEPGVRYDNPQYFKRSDTPMDMHQFIKPIYREKQTPQSVRAEIDSILATLDTNYSDGNILSNSKLITPLLKHQEVAVNFIHRKESFLERSPWCQELSNSRQPLGGIIADAMGLGKTLTMISAILFSLDDANDFMVSAGRSVTHEGYAIPTKSTLVVVPSTHVWLSEIERHVAPDSMHVSIFHGSQRERQANKYLMSDIVLTTYSTLAADQKLFQTLHNLNWFRIILDEAHWIRNSSSRQFRAINQLQGSRRWCLTGTPIQNKLEDLCALITFLKIPPFEHNAQAKFKQHIIDPLFSDTESPSRNLRLLLQSLCLRRTKQVGHSVTVKTELVTLLLSPMEQMAYNEILYKTRQEMEVLVSNGLGSSKYTKLFTAIHKLRMLCVQGVNTKGSDARTPYLSPITAAASPYVDIYCELCYADESLGLIKAGSAFCPDCGRLLSSTQGTPRSGSRSPRPANPVSPASDRLLQYSCSMAESETATKLTALMENLVHHTYGSKSIVFTFWTQTLDILCPKLERRGVHQFQNSPHFTVLLMTYGTGAVGLNLTAANRIHLLEPQWNPSVEEQAIGRAVRLGQAKEVTVIRYVMEHTVEEVCISDISLALR